VPQELDDDEADCLGFGAKERRAIPDRQDPLLDVDHQCLHRRVSDENICPR